MPCAVGELRGMQTASCPQRNCGRESPCMLVGVELGCLPIRKLPLMSDVFHVSHCPSATQLPAEIPLGPVALCPALSRGLPLSRPSQHLSSLSFASRQPHPCVNIRLHISLSACVVIVYQFKLVLYVTHITRVLR